MQLRFPWFAVRRDGAAHDPPRDAAAVDPMLKSGAAQLWNTRADEESHSEHWTAVSRARLLDAFFAVAPFSLPPLCGGSSSSSPPAAGPSRRPRGWTKVFRMYSSRGVAWQLRPSKRHVLSAWPATSMLSGCGLWQEPSTQREPDSTEALAASGRPKPGQDDLRDCKATNVSSKW